MEGPPTPYISMRLRVYFFREDSFKRGGKAFSKQMGVPAYLREKKEKSLQKGDLSRGTGVIRGNQKKKKVVGQETG